MSKDDIKQKTKSKADKKKKGFLSSLIQVEKLEETVKPEIVKEEQDEKIPLKPKTDIKLPESTKDIDKQAKQENQAKETKLTEDQKLLVRTGSGINLIPKKSKAEVKKEKKKFSFSLSSIASLIVLVVLSLGVVFFNIISKQQLQAAKQTLYEKEAYLESYTDKFVSNDEILERIDLYRAVQRAVFSPREVVEYIITIVDRERGINITSFNMTDGLDFEMSGGATELESVAKIWYLLGVDPNIINVNLASVGKGEKGVSFSFEGTLNEDKFKSN
jgi:hypothetical protein